MLWLQLPFNERFENMVQVIVAVNQGAFFVVLALEASLNCEPSFNPSGIKRSRKQI